MNKYKITANKNQLESFGIDYDITGLIGRLKRKYPTGWYCIEITHDRDGFEFTNDFDIPKTFLKRVSDN
jgi:hypothetical protein